MKPIHRHVAVAGILGLLLVAVTARGDDDNVPSFKSSTTKRETKEFVTKVGSLIVKAARAKPQKLELDKYEYTTPKEGRTELHIKMKWVGAAIKTKYTSDIKILIDSKDKDKWEVLRIEYENTPKSALEYNRKKVDELIKEFNK